MKLSKRQLKRIIREEKQKLQELDFSGPAVGTDADVYGTPEQAELEDALIECFCNWMTTSKPGWRWRQSFESFLKDVASKLGSSPSALVERCKNIK